MSLFLYCSFQRWVPPSPNPSPMTNEKEDETIHHVCNPPFCKCGYHSELANPPTGLDYAPFWHCPIPLSIITHRRCLSIVVMKVLIYYT
jgi:hypothetical protein